MTITFYNNSSPYNAMSKSLQTIGGSMDLPLKKDMDVLKPVFEMNYNLAYPQTINYMYIEDFKRYYFTTVKALTGGRVEVSGEVDPLMSWKTDILKHGAWVERQINYNNYLRDDKLQQIITPYPFARKLEGLEFKNMHYILIANGVGG